MCWRSKPPGWPAVARRADAARAAVTRRLARDPVRFRAAARAVHWRTMVGQHSRAAHDSGTDAPRIQPQAQTAARAESPGEARTEAAAEPRRALVVMAHPDDIEFTCGGTSAKLAAAGWEVTFCLVTSGDKGTKDETLASHDLATLREAEQEAAARELGVQRCIFLRVPDGFVEDGPELRGLLVRTIREVRPELLITWDGYRGFNHRDHRTVGLVALDAAFPLARNPHTYPEQIAMGLAPHRVNTVLLAGTREPDYFVDVSEQIGSKVDALRRHASQVQPASRDEWLERLRKGRAEAARRGGVPWAEAFRRLHFGGTAAPNRQAVLRRLAKERAEAEQAPETDGDGAPAAEPTAAKVGG